MMRILMALASLQFVSTANAQSLPSPARAEVKQQVHASKLPPADLKLLRERFASMPTTIEKIKSIRDQRKAAHPAFDLWPPELLSPDDMVAALLKPLENYMRQIKIDLGYAFYSADTRIFERNPRLGLPRTRISFRAEHKKVGKRLIDSVVVHAGTSASSVISLIREGEGLDPLADELLLNFKFPPASSADRFEVDAPGFRMNIRSRITGGRQELRFYLYDEYEFNTVDSVLNNQALRNYRAFYQGVDLYGDITAQLFDVGVPDRAGLEYFLNSAAPVSPITFFQLYSAAIFSEIYSNADLSFSIFSGALGWPYLKELGLPENSQ